MYVVIRNTRRRRKKIAEELARKQASQPQTNWQLEFGKRIADRAILNMHEEWHKIFSGRQHGATFFLDDDNFHFGDKKLMNISVIHEDETENEIDVELCCPTCSAAYGWTPAQFVKVWDMATKSEPIKIPSNVDTAEKFKQFVKTL